MQSERIDNFSNISYTEYSVTDMKSDSDMIYHRKRKRSSDSKNFSKKEENRILQYALKLSAKEYKKQHLSQEIDRNGINFPLLPNTATFKANDVDFLNFIGYVDSCWKSKECTGVLKIVPPNNWIEETKKFYENEIFPKIYFDERKLPTRVQKLNQLYQAKKFDHAKDFNYFEYKELADNLYGNYYDRKLILNEELNFNEKLINEIEEDYWNNCKNEKNVEVHYAADISFQHYFSKNELTELVNKKENDFNLINVNNLKNSLLQFTKNDQDKQISGITIPWFYYGMIYSTFCWHTEDLYLYSLNYLHQGSPKIWYSIPSDQKEKMDDYIRSKYYAILMKEPDLIHKLTIHINPLELVQNGIKVHRTVQYPGEIIVTLPKGYHSGFSTGLNLAEAVNFSNMDWIEYGLSAEIDYKKNNRKLPVFPMEWIIMQNFENLRKSNFDNLNMKKKIKSIAIKVCIQELDNRIEIESFFKLNSINYMIEEIDKNDNDENFICDFCTKFSFLSQLVCNNCRLKGCINHSIQCKCLPTNFIIRYRYSNLELYNINKKK